MKSFSAAVVAVLALPLVACEIAMPFEGPGYSLDEGLTTDAAGPFTASTTILVLADGDENKQAFDAHMNEIQEALKTQPGLVGYSLALSLDGYRTLAVWESEYAMLEWVVSDVHAAAMVDMADKSKAGRVHSWQVTREETPPSWDDAKARLENDGREVQ